MALWVPLSLLLVGMRSAVGTVHVVDMTHDFGARTLYWPGNTGFSFTIGFRGNSSAGYWYESNSFSTGEHGGTHVDSPAHFYEGAWRVDDIPASHLIGPAVVLDVTAKADNNPDYLLSVKDVEDWEDAHGPIPAKSVVLMNSGWGRRYPNATLTFNTATPNDPSTFHFPGVHPDTATFLATRRDVIAVGVDTPSMDYGQSTTFPTHIALGRHNVLGLENVANLHRLPARGATVVIGLVKLVDGSGGPVRILGLTGEGADIFKANTSAGRHATGADVMVLSCMLILGGGWLRG